MPSVLRRPRALAVIATTALACGAAGFGLSGTRATGVPARAAGALAGAAVARGQSQPLRPAWYGMRVVEDPVTFTLMLPAAPPPAMDTAAGILVDLDAGAIIWERNAHAQLPPASTVKILTAMVALENFSPARTITVTSSALHQAADETVMGIAAGQVFTVEELLTGMLLVSGNDAATAIAEDTVGLPRFVAAMNAQVAALGLHDSHFTTPVGLQDPEQYTSAYDLAAMSAATVRDFPLFDRIVATRSASLPATSRRPQFDLQSINLLLGMYPFAVGVKPGWTGDAGYCEVGMAVRSGHRLISVLLNAPYDFSQTRRLLDWGFVQEGLPSTLPSPTPSPSAHG
jgi:D-alanyl-D-alanine carboxypeptidase (penicillin-binding protein 5/6)